MNFDVSNCIKFHIFRGSNTDPAGELTVLPSWWGVEGLTTPSPWTPSPLRASFLFMFKHSWAPKRSWEIYHGVLEKSCIFWSVKEWEPCKRHLSCIAYAHQLAACYMTVLSKVCHWDRYHVLQNVLHDIMFLHIWWTRHSGESFGNYCDYRCHLNCKNSSDKNGLHCFESQIMTLH